MARETADAGPSTALLAFLIADVRGYTRFTRERGDAAAAMLATKFAELARDAVEARSGRVIELRGDEALAVFESAAQAVRAAVEFQAACAEETQADPAFPLPVGIGIDFGEAVPVEDGYRGVALNMAARLCSGAGAGQVLVTRTIARAAETMDEEVTFVERGPASFKGFEQAVDVIEAIGSRGPESAEPGSPAVAGEDRGIPPELDPLTPLVDREHEMRWLRGTWRQVRRGRGRVLFVSGAAQIGKTRVAGEIAAHIHDGGGVIRYAGPGGAATAMALSAIRETLSSSTPALLVLDDVDVAGPAVAQALSSSFEDLGRRPALVLALVRDPEAASDLSDVIDRADERGDGHRALAPFDLEGVRGIVRLYVGADEADVPVESMARASQGVPGRVHEVVSDWARSEASRRLAAAAEFLAAGRDRHASDLEFANNVIGLKLGRLYSVEGRDVLSLELGEACPYKGLAAFDEEDSACFFGRERLVGELAARTVQVGLLGVVGASGSGKSSVIAAGLMPSLRAGLLPGSEKWTQVSMRPGEHPMQELRASLSNEAQDPLDAAVTSVPSDGRLLVVIDQFEETFTTCGTEEERAAFIDVLTHAARRWPDRVAVILAIRGDYYAHCAPYPDLAELMAANHVLVGPLTREELRRAVELPARRAGLRVESALAEALVEEAADEPGGLPLLSTALVELWQARQAGWMRMEAYVRTGGVRGAVARLAESSYEQLSSSEQQSARRVFLRLAATGEGEAVTRRRVPLEEFDLDRDVTAAGVIARLVQDRLLTRGEGTVEVAHEALLREWPRLVGWLEEDAQGRQLRHHLTQASRQWRGSGQEPSELYRGARLSATLDWASGHGGELNELEREFLGVSRQASEREAERQRRTNRRLRGLLVGVAVFLVVALVAGGLALVQRGKAQSQRTRAERAAVAAEAQRLGAQSLVAKSPDLSLLLARQAVALNDSQQTRSTLLAALLRWQGAIRVIRPNGNRLLRLAVSPTNNWVAFSDNDNTTFVYDARMFRKLRTISGFVDELAASRDGRWLFLANAPPPPPGFSTNAGPPPETGKETIEAYDVSTGHVVWTAHGAHAGAAFFRLSPDGRFLAWVTDPDPHGDKVPVATAFRASDGATVPFRLPGGFRGFAFVGTDRVVTSVEKRTEIVDPRTGRILRTFSVQTNGTPTGGPGAASLSCCTVSPDGSLLAVGESTGNVQVIDLASGRKRELVSPIALGNSFFDFSPDGSTLAAAGASGGSNGVVVTWDVATGTAQQLRGHTGNVTDIGFSGDGRTMYTDGLDGTAVVWDLAGDRGLRRPFDAHNGGEPAQPAGAFLPYFAFTPDGRTLAVSGHVQDHVLRFLDTKTLTLTGSLPKDSFACCAPPSFDARGDRLATVDTMGVDIWDVATKKLIRRLYSSTSKPANDASPPVDAVAFSPDGTMVAANDQNAVLILDANTGRIERRLDASAFVEQVLFNPRGDLVGAWDDNRAVTVWDVRSGRQLWRVKILGDDLWLAAFSDRYLAIGTSGGLVHVYQARTGRPVGKPFVGDACFVLTVSFNPVTGVLASTGCDGTATLTDPSTGQEIGSPLPGSPGAWSTVGWDPTGRRLAILGNDGTGFMWDMSLSDWEALACQTAGRTLTRDEWKQFLPDRPYQPACRSS